MAEIARWLSENGLSCGLARLYKALAEKAIRDFTYQRAEFLGDVAPYLRGGGR
jgi:hypothetical protein